MTAFKGIFSRQVGLELQHDGGVLHALDLSNSRYVVDDKSMGRPYIFGAQEVDAEQLRREWSDAVD